MSTATTLLTREDALARRRWYVVDADGVVLGRLATTVASILRGKNQPHFTPSVDSGDFVVVVNAATVRLTGNKEEDKRYWRHSGYPGGIRSLTASEVRQKTPERLIRKAVEGMLPKNRLSRALITKLKIYSGPDHPHEAQQPEVVTIGESN